jgi:hypothetical protein
VRGRQVIEDFSEQHGTVDGDELVHTARAGVKEDTERLRELLNNLRRISTENKPQKRTVDA